MGNFFKVDMICMKCGNITVKTILKHFQKKEKRMRLYCYKCMCDTTHIQLIDKDIYLLSMDDNDEFKQDLTGLVKKRIKK